MADEQKGGIAATLMSAVANYGIQAGVANLIGKFQASDHAVAFVAGLAYEAELGPGTWANASPDERRVWKARAKNMAVGIAKVLTPRVG